MTEIRRILCPIDFSDHSRRALDHAVAIARYHKAVVTVLHVYVPAPIAAVGPFPVLVEPLVLTPLDRDRLLAELQSFVEPERAAGVTLESVVREGPAVGEILEQAMSTKPDLLVIGTHGRSGFDRLVLGSVAERVLRKASCPVMTVPAHVPDAVPVGSIVYDRILCPVDFSDSSLHALKHAVKLAEEAGGQLTVVHVIGDEVVRAVDLAGTAYDAGMTVTEFAAARDRTAERRLHLLVGAVAPPCHVDALVTHGRPWREVLRIAAQQQSDLIVIGVQGRGAADLMFLGSTTQHVVRDAACPVLTLRRG